MAFNNVEPGLSWPKGTETRLACCNVVSEAPMGFFQELTAELDRTPVKRIDAAAPGAISEVLKYAPLKLRPRRNVEDRLSAEKYWRERASRAEVRVKFLENSIQSIAARVVKS